MVHFVEYSEDKTAYENLDGLLHVITPGQEYGTAMGSSVRVTDVAVNILKV